MSEKEMTTNWAEMLAVTSQEVKKQKNALKIHEIVTKLSGLDAWVKEAENNKKTLEETNERLEAKKIELKLSIVSAKKIHTDVAALSEELNLEVGRLNAILESENTERKELLEAQFKETENEAIMEYNKNEQERIKLISILDEEIGMKQKKVEEFKETLKNLRTNVALAEKS